MSAEYFKISYAQVAMAAGLILFNGLLSFLLGLGIGRQLVIAAVRTVGQLLLIGLVLEWVFAVRNPYLVVAMMALMTGIAGMTAVRRTAHRYPGMWVNAMISIFGSSWLLTAYAVFGIFRFEPWYLPQFTIPVLGMILGNSLSGISLALDRFSDDLILRREAVETQLALGATAWEAARPTLGNAIRVGMIPMLNAMMVAGLVSLPGMMTGQLLAGISPVEAVKYQVVIMFLLASTTMLGTIGVTLLGYRRLFTPRHQFVNRFTQ